MGAERGEVGHIGHAGVPGPSHSCGRLARHGVDPDEPVFFDPPTMQMVASQGAHPAVEPRERVYLLSAAELETLLLESAGAATRPLLEDNPDYVFPADRVRDAVKVFIRQADTGLRDKSSLPIESFAPVPLRIAKRYAMLQFLELHGYSSETTWDELPEEVRQGMVARAERTLKHLWPQLTRYFSIPEVLCLAAVPPSEIEIRQIALAMYQDKADIQTGDVAERFDALEEPIRANFENQAKVALHTMGWRHGRRGQRHDDQLDPEDAKMVLSVLDGQTDRRALHDLGTLTKLIALAAEGV